MERTTCIFPTALLAAFAWPLAIVIISRCLSRGATSTRVFLSLSRTLVARSRARHLDRRRVNGLCGKMDGKSAVAGGAVGPQTILPAIMTAEITRNRKTNRVDYYRRDSAPRCAFPPRFLSPFFPSLAFLAHFAGRITYDHAECALNARVNFVSSRELRDAVAPDASPDARENTSSLPAPRNFISTPHQFRKSISRLRRVVSPSSRLVPSRPVSSPHRRREVFHVAEEDSDDEE